jgi:hypothetical protein
MNMPLTNTSGNRTRDEIIITLDGALDGGEDNIKPNDEKQAAAIIIPKIKMTGWIMFTPIAKPMPMGNRGIIIPNKKDANMSPNNRVVMEIGADINLSKVCNWASQGAITGETAVAVKNTVIPIRPEIRKSTDIFLLPMKKARNKNNGIKNPNMTTGPFK